MTFIYTYIIYIFIYGIWHMIYSPLHLYDVFHCFYISKKTKIVEVGRSCFGRVFRWTCRQIRAFVVSYGPFKVMPRAGGSRVNVRNGRMFRFFFGPRQKTTGIFTSWNGTPIFGGWDQTIENIQIYGNVWGISLVRMMVPLGWGPLYNQPFFRGLQQRGLNS